MAPTSLSPVFVERVLRGQLGYQGVVVTDAMDAQALLQFMQQQDYTEPVPSIAETSVRPILAGDDIVGCPIEPDHLAAVVAGLTAAVSRDVCLSLDLCTERAVMACLKARTRYSRVSYLRLQKPPEVIYS